MDVLNIGGTRMSRNSGMRVVLAALILLLLSGLDARTEPRLARVTLIAQAYVHVDDLKRALKSEDIDLILEAFNNVKMMRYQGMILPFIQELWEQREDKYPDLPWPIVTSDIVRIEIADVLIQAERNGLITMDIEPIRSFVSQKLKSTDVEVQRRAILITAISDDDRNIEALLDIAKGQAPATFRASVTALSRMCSSKAASALDQLDAQLNDDVLKRQLRDIRRGSYEFKAETGICE